MKLEIKDTKSRFEPIELTITVESAEELCDLWHRLDVGIDILKQSPDANTLTHSAMGCNHAIWNKIDDLVLQKKLR